VDRSSPSVAQRAADVSGALAPRSAELSADIYDLILREIPQLRRDMRILALLEASVTENVHTLLHILRHGIDLENVRAPAAAEEYARRLAQRDVPIAALLRAYRIGSTRFQDRCLEELGRNTDDAALISMAGLRIFDVTAAYIDRISEELVSAYEAEKEDWLRNRNAARASRVRALLAGQRADVGASETILGYRLRQHHVAVVCWAGETGDAQISGGTLARLERAAAELGRTMGCAGQPLFLPQDEFSAWAWLPLGARTTVAIPDPSARFPGAQASVRFALGEAAPGLAGFRRTHQQALGAYALALAGGPSGQSVTGFADVAPVALMSGSIDLLRAWVIEVLGSLADDDDGNASLRGTLRVFLQENGSFKATAERLALHKNTVQYRVRKARESLGRPAGENRLHVELALLASQWLGAAVLRQAGADRESSKG
jgi:hypothetical protein